MSATVRDRHGPKVLRIGQLASEAGVNPKTIRYYEDVGLLPQPMRSESRYRLYTHRDRKRLDFILRAKQTGFSLAEIRGILEVNDSGEMPCNRVLHILDEKITAAREQLRALTAYYRHAVKLRTAARRFTEGQLAAWESSRL